MSGMIGGDTLYLCRCTQLFMRVSCFIERKVIKYEMPVNNVKKMIDN